MLVIVVLISAFSRADLEVLDLEVNIEDMLLLQRDHSLFGTVISALTLGRSGSVVNPSRSLSLTVPSSDHSKLSPTNSLHCPQTRKSPTMQNSVNVRDLFPLTPHLTIEYCNSTNHSPTGGITRSSPSQRNGGSSAHLSPVSSTDESCRASQERCVAFI